MNTPSRGYRSPTPASRWDIPERRPALVANSATGRSVLYDRMPERERLRFDVQLAAYRAAVDMVRATTQNATYGVPVPHDVVVAWNTARDELDFQVGNWQQRREYRQHMIRETGGGQQ